MQSMSTGTPSKAKVAVKLVTLEKGLKLAESWVSNMSESVIDEPTDFEFDGRPPRLGLGAKAAPQSRLGNSADPIERRILAKVNTQKRNAARSVEESKLNVRSGEDDDDSDDELESRAKAFTKKRVVGSAPTLQANKKKR